MDPITLGLRGMGSMLVLIALHVAIGVAMGISGFIGVGFLIGHKRGGLAMATIGGCAGFGAVCGSSVATAATFTRVALPEMMDRNYQPGLAGGCIAAGGTLGMIIPPSLVMIIYGILTEEFVIALFAAAIISGLISVVFYFITICITTRINPEAGPAGPPIGMNVFVLHGVAKDLPLKTIFGGILPFFCADVVRLAVIVLFPGIVLYLPRA